jgi:hypothetical protein
LTSRWERWVPWVSLLLAGGALWQAHEAKLYSQLVTFRAHKAETLRDASMEYAASVNDFIAAIDRAHDEIPYRFEVSSVTTSLSEAEIIEMVPAGEEARRAFETYRARLSALQGTWPDDTESKIKHAYEPALYLGNCFQSLSYRPSTLASNFVEYKRKRISIACSEFDNARQHLIEDTKEVHNEMRTLTESAWSAEL